MRFAHLRTEKSGQCPDRKGEAQADEPDFPTFIGSGHE
jgi:hypothetical protein